MNGNIPRTSDDRPLTRQEQLLLLIEQATETDQQGTLTRYWLPKYDPEYIMVGREHFNIGRVFGSSDAASLKALARKGLIVRPHNAAADFAYRITEDGLLRAQSLV